MSVASSGKSGSLRLLACLLVLMVSASVAFAQGANDETNWKPTGKGYGVQDPSGQATKTAGGANNGISYHGGPVMTANPVNIQYLWYGNWNSTGNNTGATQTLLQGLITGLSGSGYEKINATYTDGSGNHVSANLNFAGATQVTSGTNYSTSLSDADILNVVSSYIGSGTPNANTIYFVLTSSDVTASSGFCTQYCGWHDHATINGVDTKYAFVGNPDRCPSACEAQTAAPSNNNSAADGMASIIAHESEEAISDPDLNAWFDPRGAENADKCAWKFGPTSTDGAAKYNQTLNGIHWLIQMNWANASGGGCAQTAPSSGSWTFYRQ